MLRYLSQFFKGQKRYRIWSVYDLLRILRQQMDRKLSKDDELSILLSEFSNFVEGRFGNG